MRRKGRTYLVLTLPDGSKSMIPAEWTDFASPAQPCSALSAPSNTAKLASLEDLLHARALVDALLSRLAAFNSENGNSPASKERPVAKIQSEPVRSSPRRDVYLGNAARRRPSPRDQNPGATHR